MIEDDTMDEMPKPFQFPFFLNRSVECFRACVDSSLSKLGGSAIMFGVMFNIAQNQGASLVELARSVHRSHPAILRIIDKMEKDELIVRKADGNDRRVKHLFLTPKGEKLLAVLKPETIKIRKIALSNIPAKDIDTATRVLKTVYGNLCNELGKN
jgi:DNA-binding MarR family transcriptional regulator